MSTVKPQDGGDAAFVARVFFVRVCTPLALAYLISYGLRTINAAIAPALAQEFSLDAADLGLLTAAYFLAFSLTQLPLGGLLDRFRPRRVEAGLLLSCAAGCAVFASAGSSTGLIVGRALIGAGVAACLMAALRTFGLWLTADKLPKTNGLMLAVGNAGAILSTAPVLWLLHLITWRQLFFGMALLTCFVAIWLAFFTPDAAASSSPAASSSSATNSQTTSSWSAVLRSKVFWAVVPLPCLTNAVGLAVQGLWAGPWLIDVAKLRANSIGTDLLLISGGMLFANILLGNQMGRLMQRGISPLWFCFTGCLIAMLGQLPFLCSWSASAGWVMTVFGLTHVAGNLIFAALFTKFDRSVHGRLSTMINFLMFGMGFVLQWGIGVVVNHYPAAAAGRYEAAGYERAFLILLVLQAGCAVWTLWRLPAALRHDEAEKSLQTSS